MTFNLFFSHRPSGGSTMFPPPTTGRRFSYGNARYVIAGNFRVGDYFLESDGEEADDEFDRLNQRIEEDNEIPTHYQLSVPHKVSENIIYRVS